MKTQTMITYEQAWAMVDQSPKFQQHDAHVRAWRREQFSREAFALSGDAIRRH